MTDMTGSTRDNRVESYSDGHSKYHEGIEDSDLHSKTATHDCKKNKNKWRQFFSQLDLGLLKNSSFLNLLICVSLPYSTTFPFIMLLPMYIESLDVGKDVVVQCMMTLSFSDLCARIVIGYIATVFKFRSKYIFFTCALLSAFARSGLTLNGNLTLLLFFSAFSGIMKAGIIVNAFLTLIEGVTPEQVPAVVGLQMLFKGIFILGLEPIIGFIRDATQSFEVCIHILSVFCLLLPVFSITLEEVWRKYFSRKKLSS